MRNAHAMPCALLAVICAPVIAQNAPQRDLSQPDRQDRISQPGRDFPTDRPARAEGPVLQAGNLLGADVHNLNNDKVGDISDLIIDPQSGYVVYGVLSHGGFLGIGDKLIAIPWHAFDKQPGDEPGSVRVFLDTNKDKLEAAPSFKADEWALVGRRDWSARTHRFFNTRPTTEEAGTGGWGRGSDFNKGWKDGKDVTIQGAVVRLERKSPDTGMGEGLLATIRDEAGQERLVNLGPAWFIQEQQTQLREGDRVTITGRQWARENATITVAQSVRTEHGTLTLRERGGEPVWDSFARAERPGMGAGRGGPADAGDGSGSVFVRASDLRGMDIRGMTENGTEGKIGDIDDLAIDLRSGRIPLVVASFGGFLGIGDSKVALPWRALDISADGKVYTLNIDETKLRNAPRLADNQWQSLNDPAFRQQVFSYFGVQPMFASPEQERMGGRRGGWEAGGPLAQAYRSTQTVEVSGPISKVGTDDVPGMGRATVISIDAQGGTQTVVLGPSWFLDRQDFRLNKGEQVTIKAVKTEVNGKTMMLATDVDAPGGHIILRSPSGEPRWHAWHLDDAMGDNRGRDRNDRDLRPSRP
jgi:sporulation protein YlmC with PRC-barrel domain